MSSIIDSTVSLVTEERETAPSDLNHAHRVHVDPGTGTAALNRAAGRRILLVEDDVSLSGFLCGELQGRGLIVEQVHDGEEALRLLEAKRRYELLMLDLNLPKLDGLTLIERVRPAQPRLPMLVLTARSRVEDKVKALESGADDCITKPFSLIELLARVQALLRRGRGNAPLRLSVKDLHVDMVTHKVERAGRRIDLTAREFDLLEYLVRHAHATVSREMLAHEIWKDIGRSTPLDNVIDVHIARLRRKIDEPNLTKLIHTVRGVGFCLSDTEID